MGRVPVGQTGRGRLCINNNVGQCHCKYLLIVNCEFFLAVNRFIKRAHIL